jgi:hypothetical protein
MNGIFYFPGMTVACVKIYGSGTWLDSLFMYVVYFYTV